MKVISKFVLLFSALLFALQTTAFAGETVRKAQKTHAVYFEIGGSGGVYSFNYGRTLFKNKSWELSANIGLSLTPVLLYDSYSVYPVVPLGVSALYGSGHHFLKLGLTNTVYLGYTYRNPAQSEYDNGVQIHKPKYDSKMHDSIFPLIGYQYQINSTYFAHIVLSPLIYDNGFSFFPWGGIGFGINF